MSKSVKKKEKYIKSKKSSKKNFKRIQNNLQIIKNL